PRAGSPALRPNDEGSPAPTFLVEFGGRLHTCPIQPSQWNRRAAVFNHLELFGLFGLQETLA
ncbi:MAG TPA: hypothetical protein VIG99_01405, partial [Myxococcaceae bacterium]